MVSSYKREEKVNFWSPPTPKNFSDKLFWKRVWRGGPSHLGYPVSHLDCPAFLGNLDVTEDLFDDLYPIIIGPPYSKCLENVGYPKTRPE